MQTALERLQSMTTIVADTGDAASVQAYRPQDCTTNPSLVLAALGGAEAQELMAQELARGPQDVESLAAALTVALGAGLADLVPGRVSTEVEAHLSFDVEGSIRRAHAIVEDYGRRGVGKERILIKLAATWEGIAAARRLERDGIQCNLTLLFSLAQAKACADAGVFLISPFVGRITDWYKRAEGVAEYLPEADPGVLSVRRIYRYYKDHGIETVVMGASFRNIDQIKALAGCDRLTIAPKLLAELAADTRDTPRLLHPSAPPVAQAQTTDEKTFRWELNADAMASEKLAEGIRSFDTDHQTLLRLLAQRQEPSNAKH